MLVEFYCHFGNVFTYGIIIVRVCVVDNFLDKYCLLNNATTEQYEYIFEQVSDWLIIVIFVVLVSFLVHCVFLCVYSGRWMLLLLARLINRQVEVFRGFGRRSS